MGRLRYCFGVKDSFTADKNDSLVPKPAKQAGGIMSVITVNHNVGFHKGNSMATTALVNMTTGGPITACTDFRCPFLPETCPSPHTHDRATGVTQHPNGR